MFSDLSQAKLLHVDALHLLLIIEFSLLMLGTALILFMMKRRLRSRYDQVLLELHELRNRPAVPAAAEEKKSAEKRIERSEPEIAAEPPAAAPQPDPRSDLGDLLLPEEGLLSIDEPPPAGVETPESAGDAELLKATVKEYAETILRQETEIENLKTAFKNLEKEYEILYDQQQQNQQGNQ